MQKNVAIILFDGFETLDVFGPVEILGQLPEEYGLRFYSKVGGIIQNKHNVQVLTEKLELLSNPDILFIPGGIGTRSLVDDTDFIANLRASGQTAGYILTVCTGAALLARTGLLDGRRATSNKLVFDWVSSQGPAVNWRHQARWVADGNIYTASGVTAGMDMTLGFIADTNGEQQARHIARNIEYIWNSDPTQDPFA